MVYVRLKSRLPTVNPKYINFEVTFINGSPQNTFVPGVIKLANQKRVHNGGDDFKSGQPKVRSLLSDFSVSAGV